MFLAVDIGNTHILLGLFEDGALRRTWRVRSDPARTPDEARLLLRHLLQEENADAPLLQSAMICSVIPRLTHTLRDALTGLCRETPVIFTHTLDLGIRNIYHHPKDVGPDRLANAAGGVARYGAPLVIVDFGTATTFDVISPDAEYLGGVIMPGLEMSADALFHKTSLLPRIAIESPARVTGRSTFESILSGIVWGSVGAVDYLADRIRAELGMPDCPVIATGGHAPVIGGLCRTLTQVDADLTLFGIWTVWERNREKKD